MGGFIDPSLSWDDLAWLRRHTTLPIGLKGVQCVEDAMRAKEMGVDAIYLSNHGHVPSLFDLVLIYAPVSTAVTEHRSIGSESGHVS